MSTRGLLTTTVTWVMLAFALAGWLMGRWGGGFTIRVVDDLGLLGFSAAAACCCLVAARAAGRTGRDRGAWLALAAGLGAWTAGELGWCYYEIVARLPQTPFPSPADAGFLLFPIGAGVALWRYPEAWSTQSRFKMVLDGAIASGSLFAISWVTVLGPVYRTGVGQDLGSSAVSLAYPAADLVLVIMTVVVLSRARRHRLPLALLSGGVVLMAVSDSWFAYLAATGPYQTGDLIDLGWFGAFFMFAMAALASTRTSNHSLPTISSEAPPLTANQTVWSRVWLPYLPLVIACLVGIQRATPILLSGPVPLVTTAVVITLLARQLITIRDNHTLLQTVSHQALHDSLTGLANRALFHDRLTRAVELQRRQLRPLGVLIIDLDGFKAINDRYGHHIGDELLTRVAERLTACLRVTDTLARLGGDEFAVLIEDEQVAVDLAVSRIADAFTHPYLLGHHQVRVTASIGTATAAAHTIDVTTEDLLRNADLNMYAQKPGTGASSRTPPSGVAGGLVLPDTPAR